VVFLAIHPLDGTPKAELAVIGDAFLMLLSFARELLRDSK
jgi:hypothetical protein